MLSETEIINELKKISILRGTEKAKYREVERLFEDKLATLKWILQEL